MVSSALEAINTVVAGAGSGEGLFDMVIGEDASEPCLGTER